MKHWAREIALATALAGLQGEAGAQEPTPRAMVAPMPQASIKTLSSQRKAFKPNANEIAGSQKLWKAVLGASEWNYGRLFSGDVLEVGLKLDAAKLLAVIDDQRMSMREVADGYKVVTGQELLEIAIDGRAPDLADVEAVAAQMEKAFRSFGSTARVGKKAEAFRTVGKEEKKPRLLMSLPRQPTIASCANGMDHQEHWCALKQVLESLGAEVVQLDAGRAPKGSNKDDQSLEVFTRDPVLVLHDPKLVLVPDFQSMQKEFRAMDADPHVADMVGALKKLEYTVSKYSGYTQGGDMVYDPVRRLILVGLGRAGFEVNRRFTQDDADVMSKITGCKVIRIKRMSAHFYHLDTAIVPLPMGKYLINPACLEEKAFQELQTLIGRENIIEIPREEQRFFANLMAAGNTLVMPSCSEALEKALMDEGFKVVTPEKIGLPTGAWDILQGAVHCMTQQVKRDAGERQGIFSQIANPDVPFYRREHLRRNLAKTRESVREC